MREKKEKGKVAKYNGPEISIEDIRTSSLFNAVLKYKHVVCLAYFIFSR